MNSPAASLLRFARVPDGRCARPMAWFHKRESTLSQYRNIDDWSRDVRYFHELDVHGMKTAHERLCYAKVVSEFILKKAIMAVCIEKTAYRLSSLCERFPSSLAPEFLQQLLAHGHARLLEYVVGMRLHGPQHQVQIARDVLIVLTIYDAPQHIALSCRKARTFR